jgi:tetrahydromethanopterin S-methyltransferase subunit G
MGLFGFELGLLWGAVILLVLFLVKKLWTRV